MEAPGDPDRELFLGPNVQVEAAHHDRDYHTPVDENLEIGHHCFGPRPDNQRVPNDRTEGTQIPTNKPSVFCPENQR